VPLPPDLTPGSQPIRLPGARPEACIVRLKGPPRQGQEHEEEDLGCTAGYLSERHACPDQRDGDKEGGESVDITRVNQLSQSRA